MTQLPILNPSNDPQARRAFTLHDRVWQNNRYVYPVVSRRSKGISIGINLNPDKVCNFDCIYCSVDRTTPPPIRTVDLFLLREELTHMLTLASSGDLYHHDPFDKIPAPLRRINDIAFSGDGEPTTFPEFPAACQLAIDLRQQLAPPETKIVVITNATMFHRPNVQSALALLDKNNGEIWAKLDAGTETYYHLIDRTSIPFQRILDNLHWCTHTRPTVIQTLLMRVHGEPPPASEIAAYTTRLQTLITTGGKIKLIQLYTVARRTTEAFATPLTETELNHIATTACSTLSGIPVEVYP